MEKTMTRQKRITLWARWVLAGFVLFVAVVSTLAGFWMPWLGWVTMPQDVYLVASMTTISVLLFILSLQVCPISDDTYGNPPPMYPWRENG